MLILFILSFKIPSFGQSDTTKTLNEVVVKGFETQKTTIKTPAAVSTIQYNEIQRYNNANPLPILNSQAGIRMEERSPGSYRLSIRGSSLRSPFGVRNVKVYWNGIPMTDANGTTYFNLLDFNGLGRIELLKGPAGSVFGGGYGGVISLNSALAKTNDRLFNAGLLGGSYGSFSNYYFYQQASEKLSITAGSTLGRSDGYRNHSMMENVKPSGSVSYKLSKKHSINYSFLASSITYQTPGGLTLTQMEQNRRASRPATATVPSSEDQNAGISQNYLLQGLTHHWSINPNTSISSTVFFASNKLENPFITSYEYRKEKSYGYRILAKKDIQRLSLQMGSEGILTHSEFDVKQNNLGNSGDDLYLTNLNSTQLSHFVQIHYTLPREFDLTAGLSINLQKYKNITKEQGETSRVSENPSVPLSLRIAVLKSLNRNLSIYYSWSGGYSSPTAQEVTANFENAKGINLEAERAISHELGFKSVWTPRFKSELSLYNQNIKDALIRKVLDNGSEYFENTGKVIQNGLEISNEFSLVNPTNAIQSAILNLNLTLNDYTFDQYINDGQDLKGKMLPGTSKTNIYLGVRFIHKSRVFLNADVNYLSKMALNSINSVYSDEMLLSSFRLGWTNKLGKRVNLTVYAGAENLFNQEYSLGYDFNAFGGRFYNPAAKINFNGGANISIKL